MAMALLFAQAAPLAPEADPSTAEEIVVIGRRLQGWSGKWRDTVGIKSCRTIKSTGDAEIDRIGCRALSDCMAGRKPAMVAAARSAGHDKAARTAALAPIHAEVGACLKDRRNTMIAELATRRAGR